MNRIINIPNSPRPELWACYCTTCLFPNFPTVCRLLNARQTQIMFRSGTTSKNAREL